MSDTVIKVDNLSKSYMISHKSNERYVALRDVIADKFKAVGRNLLRFSTIEHQASSAQHPVSSNQHPASSSKEQFYALRDVSFEIKQGERVGIIGRNGAGKTTLLKLLSRITEPTSGRIEITGRVASLLEVGTGFHPELTGRENIFLNGAILGMSKWEIKKKFDEIVAFAEIEKFLDTPVKRYSSGMYVRLAFAVAAHLEPEILIVDEVLAVGDAAFQKKCLGKMGEVAKEGRTVLFVSHNMAAIRKLCNNALLLEQGKIETAGTMDSVVNCYLNKGISELAPTIHLLNGDGESPVENIRLCFLSNDGTPKAQFAIFENWQVILEFTLIKPVEHVIAAIGLMRTDGLTITTYWSESLDLMSGNFRVTFPIDLALACQELQLAVGISSYERALYYSEGIGHIQITDIAMGQQPVRSSGTGLLCAQQRPRIHSIGETQVHR